jgi:hypothetical protein
MDQRSVNFPKNNNKIIIKFRHNSYPPHPTMFSLFLPKRGRSGTNSPREESLSLEDPCVKRKKGGEGG